ncbi:hypothetical protein CC86DRAFT_247899, partial [Ophiobolus disseminans]
DHAHPRCDFKIIEAISDELITDLVLKHCGIIGKTCHASVLRRAKGAYNFAAIVSLTCGDESRDYVVRIPGPGTPSHWTSEDEYMMEREVQLITHIRKNTTAPVPDIIDYSKKLENPLGFPYVLMTALPGKNAYSIWYD